MNAWFFYFLRRSVSERRGRFLIASAAVMLAVMVVTALVTISLGVREKLGAELRQYGANMIVTDRSGGEIDLRVAEGIRSRREIIRNASFQVYGTAALRGVPVEVLGVEPEGMTGYRVIGQLPAAPDELMVGVNLKSSMLLNRGNTVRFDAMSAGYRVTALFEKGPDDDSTVVMPLAGAQRLLGKTGISALLLNVDPARLGEAEAALKTAHPLLDVKTLRQVAVAEARILGRMQLLMLMVSAVVLMGAIISLGSTMTANVIERREEIGLMKSLGATRRHIRALFTAEAAAAGLAGGAVGCAAGITAAEAVSRAAFGSFLPVQGFVLPLMIALGVCIAVLSTALPVRDAVTIVPAQILRGE